MPSSINRRTISVRPGQGTGTDCLPAAPNALNVSCTLNTHHDSVNHPQNNLRQVGAGQRYRLPARKHHQRTFLLDAVLGRAAQGKAALHAQSQLVGRLRLLLLLLGTERHLQRDRTCAWQGERGGVQVQAGKGAPGRLPFLLMLLLCTQRHIQSAICAWGEMGITSGGGQKGGYQQPALLPAAAAPLHSEAPAARQNVCMARGEGRCPQQLKVQAGKEAPGRLPEAAAAHGNAACCPPGLVPIAILLDKLFNRTAAEQAQWQRVKPLFPVKPTPCATSRAGTARCQCARDPEPRTPRQSPAARHAPGRNTGHDHMRAQGSVYGEG